MIIASLTGGLGNQMFQYAFGRKLSLHNDTTFKLHFVDALFNSRRNFQLDKFNIKAELVTKNDLVNMGIIHNSKINRVLYLLDERLGIRLNRNVITQRFPYKFEKKYLEIPDNSYVQGFWSDAKYFYGIEQTLKEEFTPKTKIDNRNFAIIERMKRENSISVHIRRGDYVTNKRNHYLYTGIEFYLDSIRKIKGTVKKPIFYFFSDDIEWCRKNFVGVNQKTVFLDHNKGDDSYKDLLLMSSCKHNIIANSTFSWWGSWLNRNKNKIIIVPKK